MLWKPWVKTTKWNFASVIWPFPHYVVFYRVILYLLQYFLMKLGVRMLFIFDTMLLSATILIILNLLNLDNKLLLLLLKKTLSTLAIFWLVSMDKDLHPKLPAFFRAFTIASLRISLLGSLLLLWKTKH